MNIIRKVFNFNQVLRNIYWTWIVKTICGKCGSLSLFGKVEIINPRNLTIGDRCTINNNCHLNCLNPVKIGNDVTLSANVSVISTGIDVNSWIGGTKCHIANEGIEIGDHVWIGAGAMILSNVHIRGAYVVIAANSVVTKDIDESYCVVAGCPAKIIKYLK